MLWPTPHSIPKLHAQPRQNWMSETEGTLTAGKGLLKCTADKGTTGNRERESRRLESLNCWVCCVSRIPVLTDSLYFMTQTFPWVFKYVCHWILFQAMHQAWQAGRNHCCITPAEAGGSAPLYLGITAAKGWILFFFLFYLFGFLGTGFLCVTPLAVLELIL